MKTADGVRRGLCIHEAALYVGVSVDKFKELLAAGLMPAPKLIGTKRVWDRRRVDQYFDALPDDERTERQREPQGRRKAIPFQT